MPTQKRRRSGKPSSEFCCQRSYHPPLVEASKEDRHGREHARRNPGHKDEKPEVKAPKALAGAEAFAAAVAARLSFTGGPKVMEAAQEKASRREPARDRSRGPRRAGLPALRRTIGIHL
jgi:hypothetical protein